MSFLNKKNQPCKYTFSIAFLQKTTTHLFRVVVFFHNFICYVYQIFKLHSPTSILEYQKTRKVATTKSYERYREILFQKVALCYLLHFVQDGSSKNALENSLLRKNVKNPKIGGKTLYIPP